MRDSDEFKSRAEPLVTAVKEDGVSVRTAARGLSCASESMRGAARVKKRAKKEEALWIITCILIFPIFLFYFN
jgi:hypothetical protein